MGAYEDMMSGTAEIPNQPVDKGWLGNAFDDVETVLSNYAIGAYQGGREVVTEGNRLAESNPLALTGTPMQDGITNAPAPQQTEEQQQAGALYKEATGNFGEETIKAPLGVAGLVNPVAGAAYLPFLAHDVGKSYEKGGVGQAARDLTYGQAVDFASQPNLAQQFKQKPVSTAANAAMSVLPMALLGRGLYDSVARIPKVNEKGIPINEDIQRQIADDFNSVQEPILAPTTAGADIITIGEKQLGKPYELGANGFDATDCGKFTQDVFAEKGITLEKRTADGQYGQLEQEGKTFEDAAQLQEGDLVFWDVPSNRERWKPSDDPNAVNMDGEAYKGITHVGIYAGEGKVLQAGSRGVSYMDLDTYPVVGYGRAVDSNTTGRVYASRDKAERYNERNIDDDIRINEDLFKSKDFWEMTKEEYEKVQGDRNSLFDETQVAENIQRGTEAIDRVINNQIDVNDAMHRPDLGSISFYWGNKKEGIKHIIDRRTAQGYDGNAIARKMVDVIANGEAGEVYGPEGGHRVNLSYDGHTAVLSLFKHGDKQTWLLTGWENYKEAPGATNGGNGPFGATRFEPMRTRLETVAETSSKININQKNSKVNGKQSHKQIIEQALKTGRKVSKDVLKDYPDLVEKYPGIEYSLTKGAVSESMRSDMLNRAHEAAMNNDFETAYTLAKQSGDPAWENAYKLLKDTDGGEVPPAPRLGGDVKGKYDGKNITMKELLNRVNDIFAPIRTGRIGHKGVEGFVNHGTGIIRTKDYGDLNVAAHEVGHLVDAALGLRKEPAFDAEFKKIVHERFGEGAYAPEQVRAEGIAEFTKDYINNPEKAKQNFPNYFAAFEEALSKNADVRARVNEFKDMVQAWNNQSPEARGRGAVSFAGDNKFETLKDNAKSMAYKAYEAFFDDKVELARFTSEIEKQLGRKLEFEQNPYKKARMVQNSSLARAEMLVSDSNPELVQATLNKLYNGKLEHAVTIREIVEGLNRKTLNEKYPEYLKNGNFKTWQQAFSTLLTAKRQIEIQKLEPGYKGPMSKLDAEAIAKNSPKELQELTEKFYQYNDNLLAIAEDSGIISKETLTVLRDKYKNYAPMMRDFADEGAMTDAFSTGKKIGNVGNPLKKLTEEGSTRTVIDPLENTIKNTYTVLSAAERNKVAQTFIQLNKESGLGKFIEKVAGTTSDANKSIFTVMVDGEKQAFQTTPEFYRAIMSMNQQSSNMLISMLKPFAQALRVGATISPDFVVRNLIRDTLTAGLYSETGFKPVLDTIKGAKSLATNKELAYEFKASGAPLSAFVGLDRSSVGSMLDKMGGGSEWRKYNPLTYIEAAYQGARKVSEAAESGTRVREFERARQQGVSIEEAGLLAKDVTLDFSRSGTIGRQINQIVPFFNAVLQGGDRFFRSFKDNPARTTAFALTYITLPSVVTWLMNHDQEWYKELPDDVKNSSWLLEHNGTIIRIPKPFEPGIVWGSSIERALDQMFNEDKDAVTQWAKYALDGFAPSIMPTLAGPLIEWITNYNFFTGKPVVGRKEQGLPDELQYNAYTSEMAKSLGSATGTSPMKIDNTINGYTASAGKFLVGLTDNLIGNPKELPAKTMSELPGIRGLTYTPLKNPQSVEEFYNKLEEVEKTYNASGKKGNPPAEVKKMRQNAERIKDLNKENRNITNDDKLTPEQKRQKIDTNAAKVLQIARKAIGKN
ncbi:MAG: hypothetical protein H6Q72_966 [Firmicutes bacterium]|nr:hypothetical protein [Bacillota bacterium]